MISKNNMNELIRKQEPKKQRFTIKKLTVGVASVLIGFTFMGVNAASAADNTSTTPAENTPALSTDNNQNSGSATSASAGSSASATQSSAANSSATTDDQSNTNTLNVGTAKPAVTPADQLGTSLREETPTRAFDLQSFTGALVDKNVHEIQLSNDINFNENQTNLVSGGTGLIGAHFLQPYELAANGGSTYNNIAHTVVIDGQGHSLNMGKWFISLWNSNYGDQGWNITFKNLKIDQENAKYSPIYFGNASANNQKKSSLTFDGVTANVARTLNTYDARNVEIHFAGDNTITVANMARGVNAVNGNTVDFSNGTTTFNINGNIKGAGNSDNWANAAVYAASTGDKAVNIESGATVNINSTSDDFRGITGGRIEITGDQGAEVYVAGKLNENLAKGHSTAIWAGRLNVDGGKVTINTMQDNQSDGYENAWVNGVTNYNGYHWGPISLGTGSHGALQDTNPSLTVTNNGELHVARGNVQTLAPMITFGTGGAHNNSTFKMDIGNGAVLDLQDGASTPNGFSDHYAAHLGNPGSIFYPGMIHMFGNGEKGFLNFGNVKYVNLQRTGDQRGVLISIEGKNNQVSINNQMPLAQWMNNNTGANPDHAWLINSLISTNGIGNSDVSFTPKDQNISILTGNNVGKLFGESNGQVNMAPIQQGANAARYNNGNVYGMNGSVNSSKTASYLQNFLDNFNWWTPRRIAFGTQLMSDPNVVTDADKFSPETQTINANTSQKLSDLNVKDGIKDLLNVDRQPVSANGIVDWTKTQWGVDWSKTPWGTLVPSADQGKTLTDAQINSIVNGITDPDGNRD